MVASRIAAHTISGVTVSSSIASISSTENIDTASSISSRCCSASTRSSSGISLSTTFSPNSPSNRSAFIVIRSMTPSKWWPRPIGSCSSTGLSPSFSRSWSRTRTGSAPSRSHLLTNAMRGTL